MHKIVGSTAAARALPNWKRSNDVDVWAMEPVGGSVRLPVSFGPDAKLDACVMPLEILMAFEKPEPWATLNDLYTIKVSHLPYDIFWSKHASDALVFKKHGATINQPLYELLKEHWKKEHGNKDFLKLNRTSDDFFNDAVIKEYSHDWLHELVAYPNRPVYESVLKEGHTVFTDTKKFLALPLEMRVKMLREEITVIALERWLIPIRKHRPEKIMPLSKAWSMSLRKTTTALTKGVYSATICENLEHFIKPNKAEMEYVLNYLKI